MSGHVLDEAVFLGVISRSDYEYLRDLMRYRNAIVHGFSPSGFGHDMVVELIRMVRNILEEASNPTD